MINKYKNDPVHFFTIYIHEAHPEMIAGDKWRPKTYADRIQRALECSNALSQFGLKDNSTILVDEFPNRVAALYGNYPNSVFIVDKEGKVRYKAAWMNYKKVDEQIQKLLGK